MADSKQNPATLAACGAPISDQTGAWIDPEFTSTPLEFQAQQLNRQFGFALETATTIARLAFAVAR
jgi:hypothetical protein